MSLGILSAALGAASPTAADEEPTRPAAAADAPSKFRSAEDGWLDLSGFLDERYGFIPLVIPITEPAVGYGAAGVLAFIDKPMGEAQAGFGRPNITAVGGLATENGTWGGMAGNVRHWLDDRLQTLVGVVRASVNLDFYGIGGRPAEKPPAHLQPRTLGRGGAGEVSGRPIPLLGRAQLCAGRHAGAV